jgi:hypothetical protein
MDIYYVYAYVRENGTPYYIGKGKGNRAYSPHRFVSKPKDKSKIVFIFKDLSEQDAFDLECLLIKFHGRKDNNTGLLRNLTDGGEGCSGRVWSLTLEQCEAISNRLKGVPKSEEHKRSMRKPKSEKTRQKMSDRMKGTKHSDKTKEKLSIANKGKPSPKKGKPGKPISEETKTLLSIIRKGKPKSEEHKQNLRKPKKTPRSAEHSKKIWESRRNKKL